MKPANDISVATNADRDKAEDLLDNAPTVSPWVETSDRLPTYEDGKVLAINKFGPNLLPHYKVVELSDVYTWWMPIPPIPEVEG